jgi:hypothetical protein
MKTIKKYLEAFRQYSFPRTRALRQELDSVREAHAGVSAELAVAREELQHTREEDAQLLADLRLQLRDIESQRSTARYQVELLERSLADAEQRQKSMEVQVDSLETRLEEERTRHDANLYATENSLSRIQKEQEYLLSLQSGLANSFQDAATRLQESLQAAGEKSRHSLPKVALIAGVLFAAGSLVGVFALQRLQDSGNGLAIVERDIHEMSLFMKQHLEKQDVLLKKLTLALNRQSCDAQETAGSIPPGHGGQALETGEKLQQNVTRAGEIRKLQASLITLGFDLGVTEPNGELTLKTRRALREFRQFYMPYSNAHDDLTDESLADMILKSAEHASASEGRYKIGNDVLAAIQLGSIRTGVDFSILMELARVESNFDPLARAQKSSATGLFQFTDNSWLEAIRKYGPEYGLESYASRVKLIDYEQQKRKPVARDLLQQEVLALRLNPRLSTLLAAENIKHNTQNLSSETKREPGLTDLYLSHFFGLSGALMFLKALDEEPTAIAGEIFPGAAARNQRVFQSPERQPRTVAEVYRWFDRKFNSARYDKHNPG